ncbi:MAG TPA: hypothetical protein VF981_10620 [Gemmatimonadaceae bacterium]|jgi:hypothetical protein
MIFIPMGGDEATPTQTRHSRELGNRVEQVIRDFQREHPELTDDEIRAALAGSSLVTRHRRQPGGRSRQVALLAGVAAALVGVVAGALGDSAGDGAGGSLPWMLFGGLAAAVVVLVAVLRIARR